MKHTGPRGMKHTGPRGAKQTGPRGASNTAFMIVSFVVLVVPGSLSGGLSCPASHQHHRVRRGGTAAMRTTLWAFPPEHMTPAIEPLPPARDHAPRHRPGRYVS